MGNAAFHSNYLYPELSAAIIPLANCLDDNDEKTRANAAGAIGNLIRNSGELAHRMEMADVPGRLLKLVHDDRESTPKVAMYGSMLSFCCCFYTNCDFLLLPSFAANSSILTWHDGCLRKHS